MRLNAAVAIPPVGARNTVALGVEANRRQESRGRDALGTGADILRLYACLTGDVPYDSITLAMVEDDVPGGHAPGYFAMLNNPPPVTRVQLAQRSRRRSRASPSSSWRTSSRTSGSGRRSAGRTITSSG